jgi:hypothetical protein
MHGCSRLELVGGDLTEPEVCDLAGGDEFRHDAHGVLDRDRHVAAVHVVDVDLLDAQTAQTGIDGRADVSGLLSIRPAGSRSEPRPNFVAITTRSRFAATKGARNSSLTPPP